MTRLGRTGTLALISALSEIGDAIETLDRFHYDVTMDEVHSTHHDLNNTLERALLRVMDVLRDGAQV